MTDRPAIHTTESLARLSGQLGAVAAVCYGRGWMVATGGNVSARLSTDPLEFWISASGRQKDALGVGDFLRVNAASEAIDSQEKPSAETAVHAAIYSRTSAEAVLHVHSPWVTLASRKFASQGFMSVSGFEFVKALGVWEEGAEVRVPIVPNHHQIPALAEAVGACTGGPCPGVFVAGHGLYAWGKDIVSALNYTECLEFLSRMVWMESVAAR